MQLGRVESHHAGQRLAVGEAAIGRHQPVCVLGGNLDMIAQHGIVPDLQRAIPSRRDNGLRAPRSRGGRWMPHRAVRRAADHSLPRCSRPWTRRSAARRRARGGACRSTRHVRRASVAGFRAEAGDPPPTASSRLKCGRSAKAVAEERKVARAAPAGGEPCERAREVRHGLERCAHARRAGSHPRAASRRARAALRSRLGRSAAHPMSSQSRRRPAAVWQRSISPRRLPATLPETERVSSRLSRVAASMAMWLCPGDPARRVEQDAGALLRRVEIGEQAAHGSEFGARGRAEPVERPKAEAALEGALAGEAVETAFARRSADSRHCVIGDHFGRRLSRASSAASSPGPQAISSNRPVEMSAAAMAQSSPARPIAASQLAADEFEQGLLGQRAGRDEPDDGAFDQRFRAARLSRFCRAFRLLGDGDPMSGLDQPREVRIRRNEPGRRTSGSARRHPRRAWSAQCRGRPRRSSHRRRTARRSRPSGRTARHRRPLP